MQKQNLDHYNYFISVIKNWAKEAEEKETKIESANKLTTPQLYTLVTEKMKAHIESLSTSDIEKQLKFKMFEIKLGQLLAQSEDGYKQKILNMLYLENPAVVFSPFVELPIDTIYELAQKRIQG